MPKQLKKTSLITKIIKVLISHLQTADKSDKNLSGNDMSAFMTFEFNNDLISKKTIEINEEKEGNSFF